MPSAGAETEVMMLMKETSHAAVPHSHGTETAEEIIGVLTAISVVSKRLAKKLALLERSSKREEGEMNDTMRRSVSAHAD